jgi:hypothetical protein
VLEAKLDYYKSHAPCQAVLFVSQEAVSADLHARRDDGWTVVTLTDLAARLDIPGIGDIGALAELYRNTPLSPAAGARG